MDYELAIHPSRDRSPGLAARPVRLLRVVLRVRNMQRSLDFYIGELGMLMLRRLDFPGDRLTRALLGYGGETDNTVLELTHDWGRDEASADGAACAHIVLAVDDIHAISADLAESGVTITRTASPMRDGPGLAALIQDPDGHVIELVGRSSAL